MTEGEGIPNREVNNMRTRILRSAVIAGAAAAALVPTAAHAASGNGVTGETIVPCTAGVCSAGAAGTYTVARAGNVLTITSTSVNAPWTCRTFVASGTQTRIECLSGANKIVAQAEVKGGVTVSKVRTKIV